MPFLKGGAKTHFGHQMSDWPPSGSTSESDKSSDLKVEIANNEGKDSETVGDRLWTAGKIYLMLNFAFNQVLSL